MNDDRVDATVAATVVATVARCENTDFSADDCGIDSVVYSNLEAFEFLAVISGEIRLGLLSGQKLFEGATNYGCVMSSERLVE